MPDAGLISFKHYAPDLFSVDSEFTATALNVIPRVDSYAPFPSLVLLTQPLPSVCRGSFFARNPDGTVSLFAGTNGHLYRLDNTSFGWIDVSNTVAPFSGTYPVLPPFDNWQFAQFGNFVIAVQINVTPQYFDLRSPAGTFKNIVGDPLAPTPTEPIPQASHVAIVNRFVVLSGLNGFPFRIQWSDLNNIFAWTPAVGLADFQDLPDGGYVHDVRGGDQFGIVFQDSSIRSLIFAPGSPEVFDIFRIATQDGIYGQYSSVTAGDKIFFYSPQGFKVIESSNGYPKPIGKQRVDLAFFADLDATNLQLFIAATDPQSTRVFWQYKSKGGAAGVADKILLYDWAVSEGGQWSLIDGQNIEMLNYMAKPGLTLEGVDSLTLIASTVVHITAASAGAAGRVRLTVPSLPPGSTVTVYGITAGAGQCVEANSSSRAAPNTGAAWFFNVIDATHIDLVGSTFVAGHTATAGGVFGGSVDALTAFSLDSISNDVTLRLAAFDGTHSLGFFSGPALEATIDTPNSDFGVRVWLTWLRPITDAPGCFGSIGMLDTAQQNITYSPEQPINAQGLVPQRVETRYALARLRIPAATRWTYATGVRVPDAQLDQGDR